MEGSPASRLCMFFLLVSLWGACSLEDESQTTDWEHVVNVTLSADQSVKVIRSALYSDADCCLSAIYYIRTTSKFTNYELVFDGIDVPPGSQILVYAGWTNASRPLSPLPRYKKGYWTRPYVTTKSEKIRIEFLPGATGAKNYTGFKAEVSSSSSPRILDVPFTECPRIVDPMDGGEIKLDTLSLPYDRTQYRFDCVWQLRPTVSGWHVYVHIDSMTLTDGILWIHNGSHADSPILKQYLPDSHPITSASQPRTTYTSQDGLYIRIQKPLDQGHLHFSYGMYQVIYKNRRKHKKDCSLTIGDEGLSGYHCHDTDWCVLNSYLCNNINDCPFKDDENCTDIQTTTPASPATTAAACPKRCDNGRCVAENQAYLCELDTEEKCKKKSLIIGTSKEYKWCKKAALCLLVYKTCPGECDITEKECKDGSCVSRYFGACEGECTMLQTRCYNGHCIENWHDQCPDSTCPKHKRNSCGRNAKCFYNSERCDGVDDCGAWPNNKDEQDCPTRDRDSWGSSLHFIWILAIFILVICVCSCAQKGKKRRGQSEARECVAQDNARTATLEEPVPTRVQRYPPPAYPPGSHFAFTSANGDAEATAPLNVNSDAPPPFPGPPAATAPHIPLMDLPPSYEEAVKQPSANPPVNPEFYQQDYANRMNEAAHQENAATVGLDG